MLHFDSVPGFSWSARLAPAGNRAQAIERARRLRRALLGFGPPDGFGALLAGRTPSFPLHLATTLVEALRQASARNDPAAAREPAGALIGVGAGLTPSGDDLVGGLLFAKRWLVPRDRRWLALGRRMTREVRERSHAVSAALLSDLAAGRSFAPLHEIAAALATGNQKLALGAARTLVSIGHSSGWDMLTGFLIGSGAAGRGVSR